MTASILMLLKDAAHGFAVAQIGFVEGEIPAGDFADVVQRLRLGIDEIIDDDDLVPRVEQLDAGVSANVSGAARNQNLHKTIPPV